VHYWVELGINKRRRNETISQIISCPLQRIKFAFVAAERRILKNISAGSRL
jgi:hypothetical protein